MTSYKKKCRSYKIFLVNNIKMQTINSVIEAIIHKSEINKSLYINRI